MLGAHLGNAGVAAETTESAQLTEAVSSAVGVRDALDTVVAR